MIRFEAHEFDVPRASVDHWQILGPVPMAPDA